MPTQNHNYARAFTADYVRICVMSIFLSVYTQTHPHLPLPLAICFHTDDFHMCWKAQQNIFSGRKVSKKNIVFRSIRYCGVPWRRWRRHKREREKNQGIFLASQIQKRFIQTFSIFLSSGTDERKNVKKRFIKFTIFKRLVDELFVAINRYISNYWNVLSVKWVIKCLWSNFWCVQWVWLLLRNKNWWSSEFFSIINSA